MGKLHEQWPKEHVGSRASKVGEMRVIRKVGKDGIWPQASGTHCRFQLALLDSACICLTRIYLPRTPSAIKKKPLQLFTDFSVG